MQRLLSSRAIQRRPQRRWLSAVNGKKYEEITIGIPKETFPLEKRVAATPEVSEKIRFFVWKCSFQEYNVSNIFLSMVTDCS